MRSDSFDIRWLGYCEADNKIWGWYLSPSDRVHHLNRVYWRTRTAVCFWAVCGKSISIKKHVYHNSRLGQLVDKKRSNGYTEINQEVLMQMWPSFYDDLDRRMIFETLSDDS